MKHFIVESNFLLPFEQFAQRCPDYHSFMKTGYNQGWLLCSGPQLPRLGQIVVARAPSLADLQAFFAGDPHWRLGLAQYRFVEFYPTLRQSCIEEWITR